MYSEILYSLIKPLVIRYCGIKLHYLVNSVELCSMCPIIPPYSL